MYQLIEFLVFWQIWPFKSADPEFQQVPLKVYRVYRKYVSCNFSRLKSIVETSRKALLDQLLLMMLTSLCVDGMLEVFKWIYIIVSQTFLNMLPCIQVCSCASEYRSTLLFPGFISTVNQVDLFLSSWCCAPLVPTYVCLVKHYFTYTAWIASVRCWPCWFISLCEGKAEH